MSNLDLALRLIDKANAFLYQERFGKTKNHQILNMRKVWRNYAYKLKLLKLFEELKDCPDKYADAVHQIPNPYDEGKESFVEDDLAHRKECQYFRRYIIAAAYCETDPERCIAIMEKLCQENQSKNFSFILFKGRLALHEIKRDTVALRSALAQFLNSVSDIEPKHMPQIWVAHILDAYRQLQDDEINVFWLSLTVDQQARREILLPYCRALIKRDDAMLAQQIVTRYRELNAQTSDELEIDDLIDEILKASNVSTTQLIQVVNEKSQRSVVQLKKHYRQIVSNEFKDYVAIVGEDLQPHEFLKNSVVEVAKELLLRKKNLQLHLQDQQNRINRRITQEDLINDWFTSLFDQRMSEARIGFRDQKRGGQSPSGKSPGEIDGYITTAKNKRISIFEAFRLFSLDTSVIIGHLNKIADYDNESLTPIFVVAYCDVDDFDSLAKKYHSFVTCQKYTGFTSASLESSEMKILDNADHLWLGMERRYRGCEEIIFYHLLLNMGL